MKETREREDGLKLPASAARFGEWVLIKEEDLARLLVRAADLGQIQLLLHSGADAANGKAAVAYLGGGNESR